MNRLKMKIMAVLLSAVMISAVPTEGITLSVRAAEAVQEHIEVISGSEASSDSNDVSSGSEVLDDCEGADINEALSDNEELFANEGISENAAPIDDNVTTGAASPDTVLEYMEVTPGSATGQWYLDAVNAVRAAGYSTGEGTEIAVIDTGINTDLDVFDDADISGDVGSGHGTKVAGILVGSSDEYKGIVPDASIVSYNAAGSNGGLSVSKVTQAIKDAADRGVDVINLSLGITQIKKQQYCENNPSLALAFSAMEAAIQEAVNKGIAVVVSAGNEAQEYNAAGEEIRLDFPASVDGVVAVSGLAENNGEYQLWSKSCYGTGTTISAPSAGIKTPTDNNGYSVNDGTSFSASMVSAAISSLLSLDKKSNGGSRTLSLDNVKEILTSCAVKIADGDAEKYGAGLLDINNMLRTYLKDVCGIDPGPDLPDGSESGSGTAGGNTGTGSAGINDPSELYVDLDDFIDYINDYSGSEAADEVLSVHEGECKEHDYEYRILVQPQTENDGIGEFVCRYCGHSVKFLMLDCDLFQKETAKAVINAQKGTTVTAATSKWDSFNCLPVNALKERPDVALTVYYLSGSKVVCFTIPAGKDISSICDSSGNVRFEEIINYIRK